MEKPHIKASRTTCAFVTLPYPAFFSPLQLFFEKIVESCQTQQGLRIFSRVTVQMDLFS